MIDEIAVEHCEAFHMGVYFLFWSHSITVVPKFGVLTKYISGSFLECSSIYM